MIDQFFEKPILNSPYEYPCQHWELDGIGQNREAARLWISGLETIAKKIGINKVIDLSATPFFFKWVWICRRDTNPLGYE